MRWYKQNKNTHCCGQIALAHLTDKSLREIVKLIGHKEGTKTKELIKVLKKIGYKCPNKLKIFNKKKLVFGIGKLKYPDNRYIWHWVALKNGKIYDGRYGNKNGKNKWKKDWKITSYLPVEKIK